MDLKKRGSGWTNSAEEHTNVVIKKHRKIKNWKSTVIVLAMVVLFGSAYAMILPALTMNQQTYCGEEEHVHTDACYEQRLICTQEEQHQHSKECYNDQNQLSCTLPETADGHKHTDSCYEKVLVCELKEHTHELICYSNPEADVEKQAVWERSVSNVNLTGVWADDLANIAKSQLGYKESKNNYIVDASGSIKGYTRYGAWYGDAYADWSGMFASFCINYAGISKEEIPAEANSAGWVESLSQKGLYKAAGEYAPQKGDLVFFSSDKKADGPDHVGIIVEIVNDKDGNPVRISVIEGDAEDEVVKTTYELKDGHITGYGKLPVNPNGAGPKKAPAKAKAATLASSGYYVGFSKLAISLKDFEYARLEGGVGVRKFYLASEEIYDSYTNLTNPAYSNQENLIAESELAYCFNHYVEPPTNTYNQSKRSEYFKNENASASLFYNATSSHVRIKDANQLYNKLLAVALNGYPNDYSGIQAKYGLSDDVFRAITQYAIWYYTDSISIYTYNYTNYYMYADDTSEWLTKNNGVNTVIPFTDSNWLDAYVELRNSSISDSYINNHHINLFKNTTGAYQHLLTVGSEDAPPPSVLPTVEAKVQIPVRKTIDGGDTPIGNDRFTFRLTGNGQDLTAVSDKNGEALFPEIIYTQAGTYTYTIEELTDERDGKTFNFDKKKKTVTVTVSQHDLQTYDPTVTYYAFDEFDYDAYDSYYYVDTTQGGRGIVMYCTNKAEVGPGYASAHPVANQTYRAIINPTITEIEQQGLVKMNRYSANLNDNLKKLFYYFETTAGKEMSNTDKQKLVWTATDAISRNLDKNYIINGKPASSQADTLLNNIFDTVSPPPYYNLAFFVPTGTQAIDHPQPLATGYGAVVETTSNGVVFNNTTIQQNSLKLGKTVTGTAGETDRLFNFSILLRNQYYTSLSGTFDVISGAIDGVEAPGITQITFSGGYAEVQLKHGQNITITGLPDGFYYHVNEFNADDYAKSMTGDPNSNWDNSQGATGAVDVEFKNHKDAPSPPPSFDTEIKAKKTLNGEIPADGQFTFILRNSAGEEIDRKTNDDNGEVTFPLTITEAGTYTYTVEEFNDGQEGIVYDTAVKTVTVTVTSETLQEIVNGNSFVGSGTTGNFKITVNGTKDLDVYCIDGSVGNPSGNYDKVLNPTTAQLTAQVTANNYGNALKENMRKLLYYFDTHSYTERVTGEKGYSITLSKTGRQNLIWCLTGNPNEQHDTYRDPLNTILAASNPPADYTVVMFASQGNAQPVIAGYLPSTNVVYEGEAGTVEFANHYEYILPETGGRGTTGYILGGLLLLFSAAILMYIYKLERRKGGSC